MRRPTLVRATVARGLAGLALVLLGTTTARAYTLRVVIDRSIVWSAQTGIPIALTQVRKDAILTDARRVGDWWEVALPAGSSGTEGGVVRVGYIRASQVTVESVGPVRRPPPVTDPLPILAIAGQPPPSAAPTPRAPSASRPRTTFLDVSGGYAYGNSLSQHLVAFADKYAEAGSIDADYGTGSGWLIDVVGGGRVWRQMSVGVGVTYERDSRSAAIDAKVPHPFFFGQLRDATFTSESLDHTETIVNIPIMWTSSFSSANRLEIFGGPSFFHVVQDLVSDVVLNEQYPYDTVSITGTTHQEHNHNAFGYHVGIDYAHFFSASTGVGVLVRYTGASLTFDDNANSTTDGRAGGVHVAGGIRFRF